jgi:metal-sulfur cluster biosynthetic enzyme
VDDKLKAMEGVEDVDIKVVWTPPWSPDMLSEDAKDQLGIF